MITQKLAEFGELIVENKLMQKWAFTSVGVSLLMFIDKDGKLLRYKSLEKSQHMEIPIGVYDTGLSTARGKAADNMPHLLLDWIRNFTLPEAKEIYMKGIDKLSKELNHPLITILCDFILHMDWESFISQQGIEQTSYFYLYLEEDGKIKDPFEDELIINSINQYVMGLVKDKISSVKDANGREGGKIEKSSGLIQTGATKSRLYSTKAYRETYYEEDPTARMSFLSEFYIAVGMKYLRENGMYNVGTRWFALFAPESGIVFPCSLRPEKLAEACNVEINEKKDWQESKEKWKKKLNGKRLVYIEMDCIGQGRISPCAFKEYNKFESELLIDRILDFIDKTSIWRGDGYVTLSNRILPLIKEIRGAKDITYNIQEDYAGYLADVMSANYSGIIKQILVPTIVRNILAGKKDEKEADDIATWLSRLSINDNYDSSKLESSVGYRIGRMIGRLDELKRGSGISLLPRFLHNPQGAWTNEWPRIAMYASMKTEELPWFFRDVEYLNSINWGNGDVDITQIVEGYCLYTNRYWRYRARQKELREIIDDMTEGEVVYRPLPENERSKGKLRYKITIEEYQEDKENG